MVVVGVRVLCVWPLFWFLAYVVLEVRARKYPWLCFFVCGVCFCNYFFFLSFFCFFVFSCPQLAFVFRAPRRVHLSPVKSAVVGWLVSAREIIWVGWSQPTIIRFSRLAMVGATLYSIVGLLSLASVVVDGQEQDVRTCPREYISGFDCSDTCNELYPNSMLGGGLLSVQYSRYLGTLGCICGACADCVHAEVKAADACSALSPAVTNQTTCETACVQAGYADGAGFVTAYPEDTAELCWCWNARSSDAYLCESGLACQNLFIDSEESCSLKCVEENSTLWTRGQWVETAGCICARSGGELLCAELTDTAKQSCAAAEALSAAAPLRLTALAAAVAGAVIMLLSGWRG